ncbi:L-ascorbate metabolism protein UlaG (beta-lactamase superfamily) [Paenibacillus endophyticus]|uniref:L-ascorbate metabolism protein UlaG (Beta-lactamase superfamily) n=1 Tax=Paenibacillus endophyticus TaxID=1294268 RepID=A0A7W5C7Z9_9BACL|nr:MBL fold metallo-hydrolase [Paenibacillus endophyticus]MBB3152781.1 L-ascorbate metabolism protein UlaG (beta-lactamase superfamily) [Paenibacillus endophyticus]
MLITIGIIALCVVVVYLVLQYYPAFGAGPSKKQRQRLSRSEQYASKRFVNAIPTSMKTSTREKLEMVSALVKGNPHARPDKPIATLQMENVHSLEAGSPPKLTWFGHSAAMLQLDGKNLLLDPMFGKAPSPFPFIGSKRFSSKLPVEIEQLPIIDAVFISHDHYDHLDYGSIVKLKDKVKRFIVPLGVAQHLIKWGVSPSIIEEHDWWDEFQYEGLRLACTPARHFSGRSLSDRDATLWCSWVIHGEAAKIFFSGDSGYGPHFKEIGNKYGPFDLTLMECGQYDVRWADIHMMPEETVQAHLDVRGEVLIPIHWGAFTLALHSWSDPIERAVKAAKAHSARIATPRIGEPVLIHGAAYPSSVWWN